MSGDPSQPGLAARGVPTIVDVARAAGVSVRTVSRVINDSPKVGAATRVTVQRVVAALGFTPSARAQAFATGKSRLIGVIQGDENAHVLGGVQQGIVLACTPSGHELVVHPTALTGRALVPARSPSSASTTPICRRCWPPRSPPSGARWAMWRRARRTC